MSHSSHEGTSAGYMPTKTENSTSSPGNQGIIRQIPNLASIHLEALPKTYLNLRPNTLSCPVPSCPLVFEGKMANGYLWRHLGRPGVQGLTGDEKSAWENLHKIEHDRLLTTRITPAQRRREAKAQKRLRTAGFERRARNIGITEEALVAQKVAIWEGMWASEQNGEDIQYDAWLLLDFCTSA